MSVTSSHVISGDGVFSRDEAVESRRNPVSAIFRDNGIGRTREPYLEVMVVTAR